MNHGCGVVGSSVLVFEGCMNCKGVLLVVWVLQQVELRVGKKEVKYWELKLWERPAKQAY